MPVALIYLWSAFQRLRRRKVGGGVNGAEAISWGDLDAFQRLTGTRLVPWEVEVIEDLDDLFLAEVARASHADPPT